MKAVIPIFLIAIAAGVAAFFVLDPLHDRAAAYKSDNEAILEQFAPPPVAKIVTREHVAYEDEGIGSLLNRAKGWTLNIVYGVPEVVTGDDVVAWYQQNLPRGWNATLEETPGGANPQTGQPNPALRTLNVTSGTKQVRIILDNLNPGVAAHTYEVVIDQKGGERNED